MTNKKTQRLHLDLEGRFNSTKNYITAEGIVEQSLTVRYDLQKDVDTLIFLEGDPMKYILIQDSIRLDVGEKVRIIIPEGNDDTKRNRSYIGVLQILDKNNSDNVKYSWASENHWFYE